MWVAARTKPSQASAWNQDPIWSATWAGVPTKTGNSLRVPRPAAFIKSVTLGFHVPLSPITRSRKPLRPVMDASISSDSGSSTRCWEKS